MVSSTSCCDLRYYLCIADPSASVFLLFLSRAFSSSAFAGVDSGLAFMIDHVEWCEEFAGGN